jgi:hypothetical protein
MLQADEQGDLKGKNAEADLNKDGVITADELVTTLSGKAPAAASVAGKNNESRDENTHGDNRGMRDEQHSDHNGDKERNQHNAVSRTGAQTIRRVYTGSAVSNKSKETTDKRRTYRFTPATDRLPTNLPSSFKSRDRNGDGQIAMSEFSRNWSKRTVGDFRRDDLNGDGIITPKEALKSNWR